MGDAHASYSGKAQKAFADAFIRKVIYYPKVISRPDILKTFLRTCERGRLYHLMHAASDLGHITKEKAHETMAQWAFNDGDIALCRAKLGHKCGNVKISRRNVAMWLACKNGITDPVEKMQSLLSRSTVYLRDVAIKEGIIKPAKSDGSLLWPSLLSRFAPR